MSTRWETTDKKYIIRCLNKDIISLSFSLSHLLWHIFGYNVHQMNHNEIEIDLTSAWYVCVCVCGLYEMAIKSLLNACVTLCCAIIITAYDRHHSIFSSQCSCNIQQCARLLSVCFCHFIQYVLIWYYREMGSTLLKNRIWSSATRNW